MTIQVLHDATPVARKVHACATCSAQAVQPGQRYSRSTLIFDGRIYDWVQCAECSAMSSWVFEWLYDTESGAGRDEYAEWAHEHAEYGTPEQQAAARSFLERNRCTA